MSYRPFQLPFVCAWATINAFAAFLPLVSFRVRLIICGVCLLLSFPLLRSAVRMTPNRFYNADRVSGHLRQFMSVAVIAFACFLASFVSDSMALFRPAFTILAIGSLITHLLSYRMLKMHPTETHSAGNKGSFKEKGGTQN